MEGEEKGNIAAKEPFCVHLKKNKTYFWCRCGLSKNQVCTDLVPTPWDHAVQTSRVSVLAPPTAVL